MLYQRYEFKNHDIQFLTGEFGSEPIISLKDFEWKNGMLFASAKDLAAV
jgi:hypothetical protein